MHIPVTAGYAAILAIFFFILSIRTIKIRRAARVAIGDGDNRQLAKAARAHANFAEYVPICLIMIYFLEVTSTQSLAVHAYGLLLITGRLIHAFGISDVDENLNFRVTGMVCTFIVLVGSAVQVLWALAQLMF